MSLAQGVSKSFNVYFINSVGSGHSCADGQSDMTFFLIVSVHILREEKKEQNRLPQ